MDDEGMDSAAAPDLLIFILSIIIYYNLVHYIYYQMISQWGAVSIELFFGCDTVVPKAYAWVRESSYIEQLQIPRPDNKTYMI